MSVNTNIEFVDANVLVYAYDASAGPKAVAADQLLQRLWTNGTGCLSIQVLQEFFVTITRKVARPLPIMDAAERVRELATWKVFVPKADDLLAAINLQVHAKLSSWDALIVHAAAEMGCDILWTEDLNARQVVRGVQIRDPFATTTI